MSSPPRLEGEIRKLAPFDGQLDEQTKAQVGQRGDERVWILRRHRRVVLGQSHAVVSIDWSAGLARTSCGLGLRPDEIADVPMGGCMPCVLCVAATPLPPEALT